MRYDHLGEVFNSTFTHYNETVNGIKIHYVMGGDGPPLVLLHGYPQTWYTFRHIMPELAKHFTVIAPDLRGLGDSERPQGGYDTYSVASDIFELVTAMGYKTVDLLGHDFGANVAYAYAASYRDSVSKLVLLDIGILSESLANSPLLPRKGRSLWWFPFHMVHGLPEELIAGRESDYINWFFKNSTYIKSAICSTDLKEYAMSYGSLGGMSAGFNYYRALFNDIDLNEQHAKIKLKMPVLVLGGEYSFGLKAFESWKNVAENIQGGIVADAGHYIPEEQPQLLLDLILPFYNHQLSTINR